MTETYLDMMEESLHHKIEVLQQIELENQKQKAILQDSVKVEDKAFDQAVHDKGELIDQLTKLNDGFAGLFEQIREEVEGNKQKYKEQIKRMQDLIREIMDLSNTLEVEEHRNKELADKYFSDTRKNMKQGRKSAAAALNYHMTMNKAGNVQPQFFDNHG